MTDIKTLRQAAGLTQKQLADLAGVNRSQVQKLERGEIKIGNLSAANFIRLCRVLAADPFTLVGADGETT